MKYFYDNKFIVYGGNDVIIDNALWDRFDASVYEIFGYLDSEFVWFRMLVGKDYDYLKIATECEIAFANRTRKANHAYGSIVEYKSKYVSVITDDVRVNKNGVKAIYDKVMRLDYGRGFSGDK
jgi:hypothetical protein